MIECETCGRRHRDEAGIEKCQARSARAAERYEKKQADLRRRGANARTVPPLKLVRQMRADGKNLDQIAARLKKDYPAPEHGDWNTWLVSDLVAETLNWPLPRDVKREMILEKHYVGEYITVHPTQFFEGLYTDDVLRPSELYRAVVGDAEDEDD